MEAKLSEGGGETTHLSSLLQDSETDSGTLGWSGRDPVEQVLWIILVVAALSHPVCLYLPFIGGMMITRMQDGYDASHNCSSSQLHSSNIVRGGWMGPLVKRVNNWDSDLAGLNDTGQLFVFAQVDSVPGRMTRWRLLER